MTVRRGVLIGAGYFSDFHLDAWGRLPGAEIVCVCDLDETKALRAAAKYGIANVSTDPCAAIARKDIDFVDIATPSAGRLKLVELAVNRGLPVICQKPLAADFAAAKRIIDVAVSSAAPFMVHENFRFQPWYREIKRLLDTGVVGKKVHTMTMRTRLGDGWGEQAYLGRQPYFRTMPRLLVHETGIHFVDTFRFLAGEIEECFASLRRLNPLIAGEDAGRICFRFRGGTEAVWDANRYNEPLTDDPRYTFGELLVEADGGSIWLGFDGSITVKKLGQPAYLHEYSPSRHGFGGDCVYACQQHFLDVLDGRVVCETSPREYEKSLRVVEALYDSARTNRPARLSRHRRIVDLSLPVSRSLRGADITPSKTIEVDGWNATTITLYSHAGTHMDAPRHFLPAGPTLDQQDLAVCCGRARVVNLAPAAPRQLLTVEDVERSLGAVYPGDRLLLRTDWYQRLGTDEYREALPRISAALARWLVERQVALIGVEPPSVADVNDLAELTEVHQTLFRGGVVIVEGLAYLDRLTQPEVEFFALPLNILGGDGCPVRAIAIEETGEHA
jgi:predicted dehydrogenase/kynurenine formamidase